MTTLKKSVLFTLSLVCTSTNTWAQLTSPNLTPNSIRGDQVSATVTFPTPVTGDLYVAAEVGGRLFFLAPGPTFTTDIVAFQKNGNFSTPINVLNFPSAGVVPGTYPLYQVVTLPSKTPLDVNNWFGGINGLSQITLKINLNNTAPTPTPTAIVQPTPTPSITTNTATGQALYKSKGCSAGGCHKADPAANINRVLTGNSVDALKNAIRKNPSDMGFLADTSDPQFASDTELQAIADYLRSF